MVKLAELSGGQFAFAWYLDHAASIARRKERDRLRRRAEAAERRRQRSGVRHLLELMEIGESVMDGSFWIEDHLTAKEIAMLDQYMEAATAEIRAKWTPEREATARDVKMRNTDRWYFHDGRIFSAGGGLSPIFRDELGDVWGGDEE